MLFDGTEGDPGVDAAPYEAGAHAAVYDKKATTAGVRAVDTNSEK